MFGPPYQCQGPGRPTQSLNSGIPSLAHITIQGMWGSQPGDPGSWLGLVDGPDEVITLRCWAAAGGVGRICVGAATRQPASPADHPGPREVPS